MSYTMDVYRGSVAASQSAVHYVACVTLFPHLIAGPIVRYATSAPSSRAAPR